MEGASGLGSETPPSSARDAAPKWAALAPWPLGTANLGDFEVPLPYRADFDPDPARAEEVRASLADALGQFGFTTVIDRAPDFNHLWPHGFPSPKIQGLLLGERKIRLDEGRRRRAGRIALASGLGALALIAIVVLGAFSVLPLSAVAVYPLVIGAAVLLVITLIDSTARGTFDSEVLALRYTVVLPPTIDYPPPNASMPLRFRVTIGSGRISTANWQSRFSRGRGYRGLSVYQASAAEIPRELRDLLETNRPLTGR